MVPYQIESITQMTFRTTEKHRLGIHIVEEFYNQHLLHLARWLAQLTFHMTTAGHSLSNQLYGGYKRP